MRRSTRRWLFRTLVVLLFVTALYEGWYAAQIWRLREHNPHSTAFMETRLKALRAKNPQAKLRHAWIPYQQISPSLKRAVVAAEDARFVEHNGFDWNGIQAALEKNLSKGEWVAGGSTISQQLAKNLFLSSERSLARKAQEGVLTMMLEAMLSKRRILEIYLNVIEWGDGVFGAQAAADYYYHTRASRLSGAQAAHLAAMIPRPRFYGRRGPTPALEKRAALVLRRMSHARVP